MAAKNEADSKKNVKFEAGPPTIKQGASNKAVVVKGPAPAAPVQVQTKPTAAASTVASSLVKSPSKMNIKTPVLQ